MVRSTSSAELARRSGSSGVYAGTSAASTGRFQVDREVARILADAILDEQRDEALSVLDVARFAENRLVPEPQLV